MAGYQQSVYNEERESPYIAQAPQMTEQWSPDLPPGLEAQLRPGETGVEYYKRMGIPLPPGFGDGTATDAPQGRRRRLRASEAEPMQEQPSGRQYVSREDDWLMGPPEQILSQAPPVDPRTIGAIEGAPWFERLKASVLFDDTSTEKWLIKNYGDENVFRDSDDALYFLPPNEAKKPVEAQVWVRFDPEGLDTGDIVSFVPGALAGFLAATFVGGTGGAGIIPTMGAAALGGVGGEVAIQEIGLHMVDESHVSPQQRAERLALAGLVEGATAGIGGIASEGIKRGARVISSGARRAGRAMAEAGTDPAEVALRRGAMERTGFPATVGQETGSPGVLVGERIARQNVMTASIARTSDAAREANLAEQTAKLVTKAHPEGGRAGADAATNAFKLRLEYLTKERADEWDALFDAAQSVAGDSRVVETSNLKHTLREMLRTEVSHLPPGDADAIISSISRGLKSLSGRKATIQQLKNALAQYGRIAYDGRGLSDKVASPIVQKAHAKKVLDALRADLGETINKVRDQEVKKIQSRINKLQSASARLDTAIGRIENQPEQYVSGVFGELREKQAQRLAGLKARKARVESKISELEDMVEASGKAREAASLLDQARKRYKVLSDKINDVIENPIAAYQENPEGLLSEVFSRSGDDRRVKAIMSFLDQVSPDAANRFRARAVEYMIEKSPNVASSTLEQANTSADKLVTMAVNNRQKLNTLFEGNPKAKQAFSDLIKTSQMVKDRGPHHGSQTAAGNFINWITSLGGVGVVGSSAYLNKGYPSELAADIGALALTVLSSRAIASGLFRPQQASLYSKLFRMMRVKSPGPAVRKAAMQTLMDLGRGIEGYSMLEDEESRESMHGVPESIRRATMLAPGKL